MLPQHKTESAFRWLIRYLASRWPLLPKSTKLPLRSSVNCVSNGKRAGKATLARSEPWKTKVLRLRKRSPTSTRPLCRISDLTPMRRTTKRLGVQHLQKKGYTGDAINARAAELTELQFNALSPFHGPHVTASQIRWLPVAKVPYLTKPDSDHAYTS